MVQYVVQVIQVTALRIPRIDWKYFLVSPEKILTRSTEQLHHREISLVVAIVTGRVVDHRFSADVSALIAAPQVAMQ